MEAISPDKGLLDDIRSMPVASDHEHHMPDDWFAEGMTLDRSMARAYVQWTGHAPDGTKASRRDVLDHVRFNSYFAWYQRGFREVHSVGEDITLENWDALSAVLEENYRGDPDFHIEALRRAGYRRIIQDSHWDPGSDEGHPELLIPAYRVDKFMHGHHEDVEAPDDYDVWKRTGFPGGSLGDYVDHMKEIIRRQHADGRVATLKCAEAYLRPLDLTRDDSDAARSAWGKPREKLAREEYLLFSNYIFHRACELAEELDIPFQIHTGLGDLRCSNPMLFEPVIERYPRVRFVLFHSGYPWVSQVGALAHNHVNVCPSLTWTVTIATSAAMRALDEYIDVTPSINTITWGGDCHVPEDSVGALLAWRFVVGSVLTRRLREGRNSAAEVETLARKLLFENVRSVYGI